MFETLQGRLSGVFDKLTKRGALTEADVSAALREVRVALLEADVALPVVKDFIDQVRQKAVGQEVLRSVTPGQMVVKIVSDHLVAVLGGNEPPARINVNVTPPAVLMMVGLQGSGKTTTTGKLAKRLKDRERKKVLMASLDVYRPAAQKQLKLLGEQVGVDTLPIIEGQAPLAIARRAMESARLGGYDVVMLDTAGRVTVDEDMMAEAHEVADAVRPHEILLVADALTGQDAVRTADAFNKRLTLTGIVLTRIDGDGRGGAALSMRAVTGCPIKLLGVGEKMDALEDFHAERVGSRILGMGDVVSLVERAAETIDAEKAQKLAKKMKKGEFDLDDLADQFRQMQKLGGMKGIMGFLPGMQKIKSQIDDAKLDDKVLKRQEAIILSMTKKERRDPKLLNASRKRRVARGAGVEVQDINRLLKMHRQMADMMKSMGKMQKGGKLPDLGKLGSPEELEALGKQVQGGLPPGGLPSGAMPKLPQGLPGLGRPGGLPGLGGGMPRGLPGLPGLGGPPPRKK